MHVMPANCMLFCSVYREYLAFKVLFFLACMHHMTHRYLQVRRRERPINYSSSFLTSTVTIVHLSNVFTSTTELSFRLYARQVLGMGAYSIQPANILRQILLHPLLPLPLQSLPLALPALLRFCMADQLRQVRRTRDT